MEPALASWPALCAAVAKACEKDPDARPPSAAALGDLFAASLGPAFVAPPGATPVLGPAAEGAGTPRPSSVQPTLSLPLPERRRSPSRRLLAWAGLSAVAAAAVTSAAFLGVRDWRARPAHEARALLGSGKPAEALTALQTSLSDEPDRRDLALLRARTLLHMPGKAAEALEAYAAAQASGPFEADDYASLAPLLGAERSLADRTARLLRDASTDAVPAVAEVARSGSGIRRLRAMTVLRDLGAEDAVDRIAVYGELLADGDCDVRRAAARRLGELGELAALPALRAATGLARSDGRRATAVRASCGGADALEAIRRIQSSNP